MKREDIFENLAFEAKDYGDFTDLLDAALEKLPFSRESAEELMDAITRYDAAELYDALFDNFAEFVTREEKNKIIQRYKDTFDVPELPWWAE